MAGAHSFVGESVRDAAWSCLLSAHSETLGNASDICVADEGSLRKRSARFERFLIDSAMTAIGWSAPRWVHDVAALCATVLPA